MVPDRDDLPFFFATENPTVPEDVPVEPEVIVIQPALDFAVHAHPPLAVTLTAPVPPPAGIVTSNGVTDKPPDWKLPEMLYG